MLEPCPQAEFTYRHIPALKKTVHRLGLSTNYGLSESDVEIALSRGINYIFFSGKRERMAEPLRQELGRARDRFVIASVVPMGFFGWSVRRAAENALRLLGTDYIDILQLGWLGRGSAWTKATVEALVRLREEGKVRAIGVSIHDRKRAGELAVSSPLDMLMIRYNAAHPGAERDIFPNLSARNETAGSAPFIVAYTATCWGRLLRRPNGWQGPLPQAGDCYRFCLSNPHIDIVLSGPASLAELDENLAVLKKGPLSDEEMQWMREFGQHVHEKNHIPFAPS